MGIFLQDIEDIRDEFNAMVKFKQGDAVSFAIGQYTGTGIIEGAALNDDCEMSYIVRVIHSTPPIPNDDYRYHCVLILSRNIVNL